MEHWKPSSPNPADSLTCARAKGCTMALVAAIVNVIATESCKPFALATTETKNTATSFWTISIQIFLPGYARSVKRVKKQQILRCRKLVKCQVFIWRPFVEAKLQRAYFRSKVFAPEITRLLGATSCRILLSVNISQIPQHFLAASKLNNYGPKASKWKHQAWVLNMIPSKMSGVACP